MYFLVKLWINLFRIDFYRFGVSPSKYKRLIFVFWLQCPPQGRSRTPTVINRKLQKRSPPLLIHIFNLPHQYNTDDSYIQRFR